MALNFQQQVSRTLIKIGQIEPFFAVLALFTTIRQTEDLGLAGTNGKDIYLNPNSWTLLTDEQRMSVICHELLHAALLHLPRRQNREKRTWNIAADIVVNGILAAEKFDLSLPHVRVAYLEDESVEEIYQHLQDNDGTFSVKDDDALNDLLDGQEITPVELVYHWQKAIETAEKVAGRMPSALRREYKQRERATQLNWRDLLWRFLTPARQDYAGYDRRFVGEGLYLDHLEGFQVKVALAIDTSGSIGEEELAIFQREIRAILAAYPIIDLTLYYADADLYGPYQLDSRASEFPEPIGGGGTDFNPFFNALKETTYDVAIYLTDGYGSFPHEEPVLPVLWIVTEGGRDSVPFGQVAVLC